MHNSPKVRKKSYESIIEGRMHGATGKKGGSASAATIHSALRSRGLRLSEHGLAVQIRLGRWRGKWVHVTAHQVNDTEKKPIQRWLRAKLGGGVEVSMLPPDRLQAIAYAATKMRNRAKDGAAT